MWEICWRKKQWTFRMHPLLNTRESKNKHSSRDAVHKPYSKVRLTKKKHPQLSKLYDRTLYAPYMHISKINHRKKQHIPKWLAYGTPFSSTKDHSDSTLDLHLATSQTRRQERSAPVPKKENHLTTLGRKIRTKQKEKREIQCPRCRN